MKYKSLVFVLFTSKRIVPAINTINKNTIVTCPLFDKFWLNRCVMVGKTIEKIR